MTSPVTANPVTTNPARRLRRGAAILLGAVLVVLLTPAAASAHATLQSSDPVAESVIKTAPTRVTLSYNEPVEPLLGGIKVFAPDGNEVSAGDARSEPGNKMAVPLRTGIPAGTYTVTWRVSSADSHPVAGAFIFHLGKATRSTAAVQVDAISGSGSRTLGVLLGGFRWLAFGSFALLIGAAVVLFACWPEGTRVRRCRVLLVGGAVGLAVATAGELLLYGPYASGLGVGDLANLTVLGETLRHRLGLTLLARLALLACLGGALWWLLNRLRDATRRARITGGAVGGVLAAGIAATWGAAGHAATGRQIALALPADITHLLAMGTWLGGLAMVAVVLLSRTDNPQLRTAVPRFSRIAFGCVVALVLTGLYQTWRQAGGLDALTGTTYGKVLLIKLGVFAGLIGVAYVSRGILRHQLGEEDGISLLRRSMAAEAAVALGVLAVTAVLVNVQPARDAFAADQASARRAATPAFHHTSRWDTGTTRGGKGTVTLAMSPAKVGRNTVRILVTDAAGEPVEVPSVRLNFSEVERKLGPLKAQLFPGRRTGEYFATDMELPLPGSWRATMFIRTTDVDEAFVTMPVRIP